MSTQGTRIRLTDIEKDLPVLNRTLAALDANQSRFAEKERAYDKAHTQLNKATDDDGNLLFKNAGKSTATTSNPTVTSGTFANIPEMSVSFVTRGKPVLLRFSGYFQANSGTPPFTLELQFTRDAVKVGTMGGHTFRNISDLSSVSINAVDTTVSKGAHTWTVQWRVTGGTTPNVLNSGLERELNVVELA